MSNFKNDNTSVKTRCYGVRQYTQHSQGYDNVVVDETLLHVYKQAVKCVRVYNDSDKRIDECLYTAISLLKHIVRIDRDFMNAYIVLSYVYKELGMKYEYNNAMSNVYRCSGIR